MKSYEDVFSVYCRQISIKAQNMTIANRGQTLEQIRKLCDLIELSGDIIFSETNEEDELDGMVAEVVSGTSVPVRSGKTVKKERIVESVFEGVHFMLTATDVGCGADVVKHELERRGAKVDLCRPTEIKGRVCNEHYESGILLYLIGRIRPKNLDKLKTMCETRGIAFCASGRRGVPSLLTQIKQTLKSSDSDELQNELLEIQDVEQ